MKIDTIKKKGINTKEIIDLRINNKDKKSQISSHFTGLVVGKGDYVFYFILILLMFFVVFIWFFSFKNNLKENKITEAQNKEKYQKIINTYNSTKDEINKGVDAIKKQMDSIKKAEQKTDSQSILESIKEEDKSKILDSINNPISPADQEIQNSLNQKELQYKLDSLK